MLEYSIILGGYAFLGAGVKYIDEAYDENRFNKKIANAVAVFCILVMGYLMINDAPSMMIFMGMIIGLIFAKKIDNPTFKVSVMSLLPLPLIFTSSLSIEIILPLTVLILTGLIDEKGNDLADRKRLNGFIRKFFDLRCMMKVGVLGLCVFGIFSFIYLIAFMLFDIMYYVVKVYPSNFVLMKISPMRYMASLIKF